MVSSDTHRTDGQKRPKSTFRQVFPLGTSVLLTGALLMSCGVPSAAPAASNNTGGMLSDSVLEGTVTGAAPVADTAVNVLAPGGALLFKGKTYANGSFDILTAGEPKNFDVTVTSSVRGMPVELRASIRDNAGVRIRVNLLTTFLSEYSALYPSASPSEANAAVARLISVPVRLDLSRKVSTRYFDPEVFAAAALTHGGLNAYIRQIVQGRTPVQRFRAGSSLATQSLTTGVMGFLLSSAAKGVGSAGFSFVLSSIKAALGQQDTDGKLKEITTQLSTMNTRLDSIEEQLNTIQSEMLNGLHQTDNDVNYNTYNAAYSRRMADYVTQNTAALSFLQGIVATAGADHVNPMILKQKIAEFNSYFTKHFGTETTYDALANIEDWKTQLTSNGVATSGILQTWNHYVASKGWLYGPEEAQSIQTQWDFMDAQWLLYTSVELAGLQSLHGSLSDDDRQQLLTRWAQRRQDVVQQLRGGTKAAAQLNADMAFDTPGDASINQLIAQSSPFPLPADTLLVQNTQERRMWYLKAPVTALGDDLIWGMQTGYGSTSAATTQSLQDATTNAGQATGVTGWAVAEPPAFLDLQDNLTHETQNNSLTQAGFETTDTDGSALLVSLPYGHHDFIYSGGWNTEGDFHDVFDPSGFLRAFPYQTSDPNFRGDDDYWDGCPMKLQSWNDLNYAARDMAGNPVTYTRRGGLYRLFHASSTDVKFFGGTVGLSSGFHLRSDEFTGCSANNMDDINARKWKWTWYVYRDVPGSELYTY